MRTRTFEIPTDLIEEISEFIGENELSNEIQGVTEDGDIIVTVDYEPEEAALVNRIYVSLDKYQDEHEDDEEDDDEEEEDEEDH